MLERFLRGIKSPSPAIRQRRRKDRKGKDCKERRRWSRDRVADSVREQDAGVVDVVELTGCGSGADVCVSGDSVPCSKSASNGSESFAAAVVEGDSGTSSCKE